MNLYALNSALIVSLLAICGLVVTACETNSTRLRDAADALSKTATECLYDVRDRGVSYEGSRSCSGLSLLADRYIEAGGFQHEPAEIALIAEKARVSAWMARAASLPGGRGVPIW